MTGFFAVGSVISSVGIIQSNLSKSSDWSQISLSSSVINWAHLQSSVFKLSKDLIDSIHEEGIVAYTS